MKFVLTKILSATSYATAKTRDALDTALRVQNFARGILQFKARPSDIFVVTYPRSGTTWVQYILYLLTTDGSMEFEHITQVCPWFERSLALGLQTVDDLESYSNPRIFKSHLPYAWTPKGARYIYVVRNSMDVAVSYYNLYRSHLGFSGDFTEFLERFMKGQVQYRSWQEHVTGWEAHKHDNSVLWLTFKELKQNMNACLDSIVAFLNLQIDADKLAQVQKHCSFESMKLHEDKFDHITSLLIEKGLKSGQFLRKGKIGEGDKFFTEEQKQRFRNSLQQTKFSGPSLLHLDLFLR
ncbi:hypothetical protein TI05_15710 [Achromatium sp. WMS3]|nr:hypothetical protein TI05_15710 [Achromatium sp. WMS3]